MHRAVVSVALLGLLASNAYADRDMCRRGTPHHVVNVGNVNIVVADSVQGKVTLKLKRVAWDLVACTIASLHKLQVTAKDNVVLVTKPPK